VSRCTTTPDGSRVTTMLDAGGGVVAAGGVPPHEASASTRITAGTSSNRWTKNSR
jgi:hypothetical protein